MSQVEEKLRRNSVKKAEALEDRERMLDGVNKLYQQCSDRDQDAKLAQSGYRNDLENQVKIFYNI